LDRGIKVRYDKAPFRNIGQNKAILGSLSEVQSVAIEATRSQQTTTTMGGADAYPQLHVFSCHTIAVGGLRHPRRGAGYDFTRRRKILRLDEFCPGCEKMRERELARTEAWLVPPLPSLPPSAEGAQGLDPNLAEQQLDVEEENRNAVPHPKRWKDSKGNADIGHATC